MMTATVAATVAVAVQVAEAIRNVLLETANVQVHIPIIATVVIGKLTNIAPTAAIHQQVDVTVVPVVVVALVETIRNAMMEITNAEQIIILCLALVVAGIGITMNIAVSMVVATIPQADVKVTLTVVAVETRVVAVRRNATMVNIVAMEIIHRGVVVENG